MMVGRGWGWGAFLARDPPVYDISIPEYFVLSVMVGSAMEPPLLTVPYKTGVLGVKLVSKLLRSSFISVIVHVQHMEHMLWEDTRVWRT